MKQEYQGWIERGKRRIFDGLTICVACVVIIWAMWYLTRFTQESTLSAAAWVATIGLFSLIMALDGVIAVVAGYYNLRQERLADDGDLTNGSWNA